ncbi:MAG TPA: DUF4249 domain-containing protein [Cyclobacteriaceae bacterium]|nr:DUF4249 domain-containing protein [Cyclobacteriaceae bacterium]HPW63749.1 DUF4249 domain-containing protein [Cyclobacteriaceae bacterium]
MKRGIKHFLIIIAMLGACVDPANIDVPPFEYQLVVDGFITTEPGPYTVKIYRSRPLGSADLDRLVPEKFAKVWIKDDAGNEELLTEVDNGVYQTSPDGIQGVTGRSYHVEITTNKGKRFESEPDLIKPVGEVTAINYEFVPGDGTGINGGDGFRIFADAIGVPDVEDLVRLRMVATYKIETFPERRTKRIGENVVPDPFPCSGYINQDNRLVKVDECTCCYCWVNLFDEKPSITDEKFTTNDIFRDQEVGFISANRRTFYDKVNVEIQELSLTPSTFQFWKLVKAQKDGMSNIFQPPSGKLKGNLKAIGSDEEVLGIFWAAGINRKSIFIYPNDVPYIMQRIDTVSVPCQYGQNSTNQQPSFWQ